MVLQTYRTFQSNVDGFGSASGNDPRDINDTEGDGTNVSGHSPHLYQSGKHTGPSGATTLTDSSKNWTPNQWQNYTVTNTTTGGIGLIVSNTSNTLTYFLYDPPAQFSNGDGYQIYHLLIAADQPGRGQGNLISRDANGVPAAAWSNDALEPCYSWNNKYNGTTDVNLVTGTNPGTIVEGRDFFNQTAMPGYTPYTYPHPLVAGSWQANLRVVPGP